MFSPPFIYQMEFIDVSQLSFIHDLGPKGLWAFSFLLLSRPSHCFIVCWFFGAFVQSSYFNICFGQYFIKMFSSIGSRVMTFVCWNFYTLLNLQIFNLKKHIKISRVSITLFFFKSTLAHLLFLSYATFWHYLLFSYFTF